MRRQKNPKAPFKAGWFGTINTNSTDTDLASPLFKTWQYIVENIVDFTFSRVGGEILKVKQVKPVIEIGPQYHQVHIHFEVEITAEGQAYLDYSKIAQFVNQQLSRFPTFTGCKFEARVIYNLNAKNAIKEYMDKDIYKFEEEPFEIIL
jgi:hypothetical protein